MLGSVPFSKKDIPVLAQLLGLPPTFTTTNGCVLERVELMCLLLRRLSYPNRLTDLDRIFVRPKSTLSSAINEVVDLIYDLHHDKLHSWDHPWMAHEQSQIYANKIHAKGGALKNTV